MLLADGSEIRVLAVLAGGEKAHLVLFGIGKEGGVRELHRELVAPGTYAALSPPAPLPDGSTLIVRVSGASSSIVKIAPRGGAEVVAENALEPDLGLGGLLAYTALTPTSERVQFRQIAIHDNEPGR